MNWKKFMSQWEQGDPAFGDEFANLGLADTLRLERYEPGRAVLRWMPDERYCHLAGAVTGGYVCVIADYAANAAMATVHAEGEIHVTPDLRMSYFRPFKPGTYRIEAQVINKSKASATVEVAFSDEGDKLMAKATIIEAIRSQAVIGFALPG